ncbi:MAG: PDDEXK nuclease domain-containing protein [Verrucomicrobiota bacterium]|nr:PDDEXK nuclease domain-containing protein [Verrucomicrobiota bacterium]
MNIDSNNNFKKFVTEIKEKILSVQYSALKAVNQELISLYWDIGKGIVSKQEEFGWGKSIVENLSKELQKEFPGIKGFSPQNLWNIRLFYLEYQDNEKLQSLSREIGWTHNVHIFQKCKDNQEREFYIKSTRKYGWTSRLLANQIDNKTFEKYLLNQTNFDKTLPDKYKNQAKLAVKDDYNFDFLEISDNHSEKELENALVNQIREFLVQMGPSFTFIGNQYKLTIDEEDYYIDLLLFHRVLKSLIAIELKIGKFKAEYAGKMNFYLSALNDIVRLEDENPAIGIIICKGKKRMTVEYALKDTRQPIGVATYSLSSCLPANLKDFLPSPQEIEKRLEILDK